MSDDNVNGQPVKLVTPISRINMEALFIQGKIICYLISAFCIGYYFSNFL